jgi:acetamidase/formamidase
MACRSAYGMSFSGQRHGETKWPFLPQRPGTPRSGMGRPITWHPRRKPSGRARRWGMFDAAYPPVVTIRSGETVVLNAYPGHRRSCRLRGPALRYHPLWRPFTRPCHAPLPRAGGHIITGPVAVGDAEPGDMLEVRIDRIELGNDWGYRGFRALAGAFAGGFSRALPQSHSGGPGPKDLPIALGTELPLAPFFSVMSVSPRHPLTAPSRPFNRASAGATWTTRN